MEERMQERRKSKRTQMRSQLIIKRLDQSAGQEVVDIEVQDVSKGGVGFICQEILQIGSVYEAYLTIWTKEVLHAFLQIVRIELKEEHIEYGARFVGMPELDAGRIEIYQSFHEEE